MRKFTMALLIAALGMVAAPAAPAGAEEPLVCKIVNNYGEKLTGDPIMYCIDDPTGDPIVRSSADPLEPVKHCLREVGYTLAALNWGEWQSPDCP